MDRQLKFRAWDGQRMIHFSDLSIGLEKSKKVKPYVYFKTADFGDEVSLAKHEIMQYTGIGDEDGKDVYEGDILKTVHFVEKNGITHYLYHRIEWSEIFFGWQAILKNGNYILIPPKNEKYRN